MTNSTAKKARIDNGEKRTEIKPSQKSDIDIINKHLLTEKIKNEIRGDISASTPYRYGVIHDLFDDALLRQAREEILEHLHFTEKETDIYRVNQTGDLASLSKLESDELQLLQGLAKVREGLYGKEFREFMSYVTGCGPLSGEKQDLSVNLYNRGCHLLTHDDVIGTRRVSYILYLTSPDEKWNKKWGGSLRLYPTVKPGVPAPDFSVVIPPEWNQMAFFQVQPGHSFHDVEEVYVDKTRLSISGWFHAPQKDEQGYNPVADEDADKATLAQLSKANSGEDSFPKTVQVDFAETISATSGSGSSIFDEFTASEKGVLQKYISKPVWDELPQLKDLYKKENCIQIDRFLGAEFYRELSEALEVDDLAKIPRKESDLPEPWRMAKPPHLRRYMYLNDDEAGDAAVDEDVAAHKPLAELRNFMNSPEFAHFLSIVTSQPISKRYVEARRFRPGHDYTLATGVDKGPVVEACMCVTPSVSEDGVGGYDLVMRQDENNDDPAVYSSGENTNIVLTSLPTANELTVLTRDTNMLRFIKYVSRNASGSRWDVVGTYSPPNL